MKDYLRALPAERHADADDLHDAMRIIGEDFGHPAHLGRAGAPRRSDPSSPSSDPGRTAT